MCCNIDLDVKEIKCNPRLDYVNKDMLRMVKAITNYHNQQHLNIEPLHYYGKKYKL